MLRFFQRNEESFSTQGEILYKLLTQNSNWTTSKQGGTNVLQLTNKRIFVYKHCKQIFISVNDFSYVSDAFNKNDVKRLCPLIDQVVDNIKNKKIIESLNEVVQCLSETLDSTSCAK